MAGRARARGLRQLKVETERPGCQNRPEIGLEPAHPVQDLPPPILITWASILSCSF